ncbi:MAG: tetratricopeptide repeat protein [Bacteroidales bacterium]
MIRKIYLYALLCVALIISNSVHAQNQEFTNINLLIRQGNYLEAIDAIDNLLIDYPESSEAAHSYIKYAYCLIEEKECGEETKHWLRQASYAQFIDDEALLNLLYGKFYHSNKMWSEAEDSYSTYSNIASRKDKKNNNFDDILNKCNNRELLFEPNTTLATDEAKRLEEEKRQRQIAEDLIMSQYLADNSSRYKSIPDFVINSEIKYNSIEQFKTNRGKYSYCKGKETEDQILSIEETISLARTSYEQSTDINEKQKIASQVIQLEKKLLNTKTSKDSLFNNVVANESFFWGNASNEEKSKLISSYNANNSASKTDDNSSSYTYELPDIETKKPDPVTYTVVIASYKKAPTYSMRQLNSKISKTRNVVLFTDADDIKYYTIGSFKDKNTAELLRAQLILEGAKNSEVIGFLNNKRVNITPTSTPKNLGDPLPKGIERPQKSGREIIQIVE